MSVSAAGFSAGVKENRVKTNRFSFMEKKRKTRQKTGALSSLSIHMSLLQIVRCEVFTEREEGDCATGCEIILLTFRAFFFIFFTCVSRCNQTGNFLSVAGKTRV